MKISKNKILITGGASGIGLAMAERFSKEDNTIIICGRRESALKEAHDRIPSIMTKQCDLTLSGEREALFKWKNIEVIEVIPPALNTDLGGKGIHDFAPPVSDFIEAIFSQLKEGKTEVTFGFSETVSKAGQEILEPTFARMNQSR